MKTVNNVSGGMTSAFLAKHYPADYMVFALVRTSDKSCQFPDAKLRQVVSDKIGKEFIGTLEDDTIIYTMLDLEQFIGQKINWVTGLTFDELIKKRKALPNLQQRFCTSVLKIAPMQEWWYKETKGEPIEVRLGFRANETRRMKNTLNSMNERGFVTAKVIVGKHEKSGRNKWKEFDWQKPSFPLIDDRIFKDHIEEYWKDKPVRFAKQNNCVGCFHRNPILLRKQFDWHPNKMEWFNNKEKEMENITKKINGKRSVYTVWKDGFLYESIKNHKLQMELFDDDFNECDSGYCGL